MDTSNRENNSLFYRIADNRAIFILAPIVIFFLTVLSIYIIMVSTGSIITTITVVAIACCAAVIPISVITLKYLVAKNSGEKR